MTTSTVQESSPAGVDKELLRLVVVGSVDDGKSTLIGRLLYESNGLFQDQIAAVLKASAGGELDFSFFTDGLKAEREQGITIDVAYRYFSTQRRKVIVADTPGHAQYTRNMATGASTADAAVILVDARLGVLAQTRRHAFISSLLGIPYLAVAINKMDLVDNSQEVFNRLTADVEALVSPLGFVGVRSFPVSAKRGDNITAPSPHTPWHQGGTLLQWLESLPHQRRLDGAPFRFPVQNVLRPNLDYRGLAGTVASGTVRVGDEVLVLPSRRKTRVASVDTFEGPIPAASALQAVVLRLEDHVDAARGDLICHPDSAPEPLEQFEADLVWFSERPLQPGARYQLKHTTNTVGAHVERVVWKKDLDSLKNVAASSLQLNDIGRVHVVCKRPLVCDPYRENRATGAFILMDAVTHDTVAAGMLVGPAAVLRHVVKTSLVTTEERRQRMGQTGCVLLVAHKDAPRLERLLFDLGVLVALANGDVEVALGLAQAGLVAVLASDNPQTRVAHEQVLSSSELAWLDASRERDAWPKVEAFLALQEKPS